jgi:hypothetical protein
MKSEALIEMLLKAYQKKLTQRDTKKITEQQREKI